MGNIERDKATDTAAPARNFTITLQDKVRAAAGPPAYIRRRRHIEDLEGWLAASVVRLSAKHGSGPPLLDALRLDAKVEKWLAEVNRLIAVHNRYYPAEANLPIHPRTGAWLERNEPWVPMPRVELGELVDRVLAPTKVDERA